MLHYMGIYQSLIQNLNLCPLNISDILSFLNLQSSVTIEALYDENLFGKQIYKTIEIPKRLFAPKLFSLADTIVQEYKSMMIVRLDQ